MDSDSRIQFFVVDISPFIAAKRVHTNLHVEIIILSDFNSSIMLVLMLLYHVCHTYQPIANLGIAFLSIPRHFVCYDP